MNLASERNKIVFIHSIANTPYKHSLYNLLSENFEIHVIHLAAFGKHRNWSKIEGKLYYEYIMFNGFIDLRNKLYTFFEIFKLVKHINPTIIVTHGYNRLEFLLVPWFFKSKIRICEIATTHVDKRRFYFKEEIKSILISFTFDYFLTYGVSATEYLNTYLKIQTNRIFEKGDFSHLQLVKYNYVKFEEREKNVLYVGRLSEEKNLKTLIFSFVQFYKKSNTTFRLLIVGEGPQKDCLIEYVQYLNATNYINFVEHLPSIELIKYYTSSKLFVLPSLSEPWGQVINEAMYFGMPILISKNCGASNSLCKASNSILFDPKSSNELTDLFCKLLVNNDELLSEMGAASVKIMEYHRPEKDIERLVFFFNGLINKNAK